MMGNLRALARQLGGDVAGNHLLIPGPGHSARDRSLSVWLDGDDIRVHSHADDDWRACRDHVRGLLGIERHNVQAQTMRPLPAHCDAVRISRAMDLWRESVPPTDTPV